MTDTCIGLWDAPTSTELRLAAALWVASEAGLLGKRPDYPEGVEVGLWAAVDEAGHVLDKKAPRVQG